VKNINLGRIALRALVLIGLLWLSLKVWDMISHRYVEPKVVIARGSLAAYEQNTIDIFSNVSPSVVSITTSKRVKDFWRRDVYSVPSGSGSGFIWDDRGHVVTNFHVIKNASSATIRLNDNRQYQASLVGANAQNDLAVLRIKVELKRPPAVAIGSSNDLKVGQSVYAIGNPFGLDYTLSRGVVSALDRSIAGEDNSYIEHLIQTDAAINPGNSGGPLIDSAGRVIGITTAIYSPSGANAGLGFAIPIDTVNRVITSLIQNGQYEPLDLGIRMDDRMNLAVKKQLGVEGIVVLDVVPGSIADQAGVLSSNLETHEDFILGDILIAINDQSVSNRMQLNQVLENIADVTELRLKIWRKKKVKILYWRQSRK
jgi:S1-C subfamily serine protease